MSSSAEEVPWAQHGERLRVYALTGTDYSGLTDRALDEAIAFQQGQVDELSLHDTPRMVRLRASIERELTDMRAESLRRSRARHPSSLALGPFEARRHAVEPTTAN